MNINTLNTVVELVAGKVTRSSALSVTNSQSVVKWPQSSLVSAPVSAWKPWPDIENTGREKYFFKKAGYAKSKLFLTTKNFFKFCR